MRTFGFEFYELPRETLGVDTLKHSDAMPERQDRVAWVDAARGIGIVLVVAGHVGRGLMNEGIASGAGWSWQDYGLYTFHMPLFFLLAGMNVPKSLAHGRLRFVQTKSWTIAYPYFLWSIVQGGILVVLSNITHSHMQVSNLLIIIWHPMAQFWFLYALFFCQIIAVFLEGRPVVLFVAIFASLTMQSLISEPRILGQFLFSLPFFAMGIFLHPWISNWRPERDGVRFFISTAGFLIAVVASGLLNGLKPETIAALPASLSGILMIVSVSRLLPGAVLRAAVSLGQASMTIYVAHLLIAAGARIVLVKLNVISGPWAYLAICTALGVTVPYLGHIALRRFGLLSLLGLAPHRPKTASLRHA